RPFASPRPGALVLFMVTDVFPGSPPLPLPHRQVFPAVDDIGPGTGLGMERPAVGAALDRVITAEDDALGLESCVHETELRQAAGEALADAGAAFPPGHVGRHEDRIL